MYGHDFYHLNFNDGDIPISALDPQITFVILKYSQGTSYGTGAAWSQKQAVRLRAAGYKVGGYHMLDGGGSSGAAQAFYFLSVLKDQPGDIVPALDFESSGQGSQSLADYKANAEQFIRTMHAAGYQVMLYGHSVVKAAWSDWRQSGADYWWCPGSSLHTDVGPVGPDLWQYSPYNTTVGPHSVGGRTLDASKVITSLPLIGGNDEMAFADYRKGTDAAQAAAVKADFADIGPADTSKPDDWQAGWADVRWMVNRLKGRDGKDGKQGPEGPAGPAGPAGPKGDAAVLAAGTKLVVQA